MCAQLRSRCDSRRCALASRTPLCSLPPSFAVLRLATATHRLVCVPVPRLLPLLQGESVSLKSARDSMTSLELAAHSQMVVQARSNRVWNVPPSASAPGTHALLAPRSPLAVQVGIASRRTLRRQRLRRRHRQRGDHAHHWGARRGGRGTVGSDDCTALDTATRTCVVGAVVVAVFGGLRGMSLTKKWP